MCGKLRPCPTPAGSWGQLGLRPGRRGRRMGKGRRSGLCSPRAPAPRPTAWSSRGPSPRSATRRMGREPQGRTKARPPRWWETTEVTPARVRGGLLASARTAHGAGDSPRPRPTATLCSPGFPGVGTWEGPRCGRGSAPPLRLGLHRTAAGRGRREQGRPQSPRLAPPRAGRSPPRCRRRRCLRSVPSYPLRPNPAPPPVPEGLRSGAGTPALPPPAPSAFAAGDAANTPARPRSCYFKPSSLFPDSVAILVQKA